MILVTQESTSSVGFAHPFPFTELRAAKIHSSVVWVAPLLLRAGACLWSALRRPRHPQEPFLCVLAVNSAPAFPPTPASRLRAVWECRPGGHVCKLPWESDQAGVYMAAFLTLFIFKDLLLINLKALAVGGEIDLPSVDSLLRWLQWP